MALSHQSVIERLGGASALAKALKVHRTRAARWAVEGIPFARFAAVAALAKRKGLPDVTVEALYQGRQALARKRERIAA